MTRICVCVLLLLLLLMMMMMLFAELYRDSSALCSLVRKHKTLKTTGGRDVEARKSN